MSDDCVFPDSEMRHSASVILEIANNSGNEEQLKVSTENVLRKICEEHGIPWNPYTYERSFNRGARRLDAVHGTTVIEYEPPLSFHGTDNGQLKHAQRQAEEYAQLLADEEGRDIHQYSVVAWDGQTISFGKSVSTSFVWEKARLLDGLTLRRLLSLIAEGGMPLVSPSILRQYIGPDTEVGKALLPKLYAAVVAAQMSEQTTRTKLIYSEWARLFGQVDGIETDRLSQYLKVSGHMHGVDYRENPQAYVFALSTYIAIVAKISAVFALSEDQDVAANAHLSPREFLTELENGHFFKAFGIENMLSTDFFSWYLGDDVDASLDLGLGLLLEKMRMINFDMTQKSPRSVRDLFKGLYMGFTPAPLRHALGEYYTPDTLASHVMDVADYHTDQSMLDPTCGSGTFLLEALRRRIEVAEPSVTARELLDGLYGFDLNPLAVLTARASIVVFLAGRFDENDPVLLPVFLADAINTADSCDGLFVHTIPTEIGDKTFSIPAVLAQSGDFFSVMDSLRNQIDSNMQEDIIWRNLVQLSPVVREFNEDETHALQDTVHDLCDLHANHWDGIWCMILFDRIEAGCIHDVDKVIGNPPWVKWSELPLSYQQFIKPLCERMNIFSKDYYTGGIESDISTVVTYHALERFVKHGGSLAFLITNTVFNNKSSQGFRRWRLCPLGEGKAEPISVKLVEDYTEIKPFEGVSNKPSLLVLERNNQSTHYPVPYIIYRHDSKESMEISAETLFAKPVPGTDAGPWMIGSKSELKAWSNLLEESEEKSYESRKGVTSDANGIYFVAAQATKKRSSLRVTNQSQLGHRADVLSKTAIIEVENVYPLLRGKDVSRFRANVNPGLQIIVPQKGMFGDLHFPGDYPCTFAFLNSFREILERRASYRRYQEGKPFWSTWSTGSYTFAPYKVVWKEMSGKRFVAAYVGSAELPNGDLKVVVPDHKLYFIPVDTENEAAYLTGFLNASMISEAIVSFAPALSLGTSVTKLLKIPVYDPKNEDMNGLVQLAKDITSGCRTIDENVENKLNMLVCRVLEM